MEVLDRYFELNACVEEEYYQEELSIEGIIPEKLVGTLFRNGNGRFVHQGVTYNHLFDGDGMISRFTFQDGIVRYSNRHVRTEEFQKEEEAGKMLFRSFGTNRPGGILSNFMQMRFKNAANTSVIYHGEKLLALWEGGLPHEIDPNTLETIGRYDYNGTLRNDFSFLDRLITPELPFSAHPKEDPNTGILYNFGTIAGTKQRLALYEVQQNGNAQLTQAIEMPEVIFTHDFVWTNTNKKVFFLTPVSFDIWKAFVGLCSPVDSIKIHRDQPTKIVVVDENRVKEYQTDFCFIFHMANGYQEDERIIIDAFELPDFPTAASNKKFMAGDDSETPQAHLVRYYLNEKTGEVKKEQWLEYPLEFPIIHPDKTGATHRYIWGIAGAPNAPHRLLNGLIKVDTLNKNQVFKDYHPKLVGEPIFVPHPESKREDEGWILVLVFDSDHATTRLEVLDATNFDRIAQVPLPHNIPLGFHGQWVNEIFK